MNPIGNELFEGIVQTLYTEAMICHEMNYDLELTERKILERFAGALNDMLDCLKSVQ